MIYTSCLDTLYIICRAHWRNALNQRSSLTMYVLVTLRNVDHAEGFRPAGSSFIGHEDGARFSTLKIGGQAHGCRARAAVYM